MQGPEQERRPEYVIWEVTRACNLRCFHCGASAGAPLDGELTLAESLRLCRDLQALGTPSVCLMGGEVFLRRDWPRIIEELRRLELEVGVITNGLLLAESTAERLIRLGVCQIGVSLDAARPEVHDSIRGVAGACDGAKRALRLVDRLPLAHKTVITSVSKRNIGELEDTLEWLLQHTSGFTWMINTASSHDPERFPRKHLIDGRDFLRLATFVNANRPRHAGRINITATHDMGYFSESFSDLHDFRWEGCPAGLTTLGVQADGSVKGCLMLGDEFVEGNVRQRSLADIWHDESLFRFNRAFRPDMLEGRCAGCSHGARCRAGCTDHAFSFTGSPHHYPFCLHRYETTGEP
jgi:radical SAM protein with 4Fe4S-binding SPASM domain